MAGTAQPPLCPPYEAAPRHSYGPHPEKTAKRSSRRMAAGGTGASWFETALMRLLTMRVRSLLRCDLPRRRRRADEVGGQLRVAHLGVLHRLLLHRTIAANTIRQRPQLHRGVHIEGRQQAEHGRGVLLVTRDRVALQPAIGAVGEDVERRAAQHLQLRE